MPIPCFTPTAYDPFTGQGHSVGRINTTETTPNNSTTIGSQDKHDDWNLSRNTTFDVTGSCAKQPETSSLMAYQVVHWPAASSSGETDCLESVFKTTTQQQGCWNTLQVCN